MTDKAIKPCEGDCVDELQCMRERLIVHNLDPADAVEHLGNKQSLKVKGTILSCDEYIMLVIPLYRGFATPIIGPHRIKRFFKFFFRQIFNTLLWLEMLFFCGIAAATSFITGHWRAGMIFLAAGIVSAGLTHIAPRDPLEEMK